jgi:hypothetical protein
VARLRPRHQVEHIVKISLLLGIGRRVVARQHAHQAQPGRAFAGHRKCLHQARQAITLDVHRLRHGLSLGSGAQVGRRGFDGWLGRRGAGWFATRFGRGWGDILCCRSRFRLRLGRQFFQRISGGRGLSRGLGNGRRLGRLFLDLGMRGPKSLLRLCRLPQENPGELGDCLHERVLRVMGSPVKEARMNCLAFSSGLAASRQWLPSCLDRTLDASVISCTKLRRA